jgi:hypothetical protein
VIAVRMPARRARKGIASIAAVPRAKPIFAILALVASLAVAGCGSDNESQGDLPPDDAATLLGQLEEVEANLDVGSCFVAADEADNLIADIQDLPSSVDGDLRRALENGAEQLRVLLEDPDQCERPTTTSETTTEETTTEGTSTEETTTKETTTEPTTTTTTPTQTTPTTPGSGGVGPGGTGQGGL